MKNTRSAHLLAAPCAALLLASCRRPTPAPAPAAPTAPPAATTTAVPAAAGRLLPAPLTAKAIAAAVFGKGDPAAIPLWRPAKDDIELSPNFEEGSACRCEAGDPMLFDENGTHRAYVLTSAGLEGHDCHSCAPFVGAVALTETPGGWRVDGFDLEVGAIGAYGNSPDGKVVAAGRRHAIVLSPGYTSQGVTAEGIVLLMERKEGGFAKVLSIGEISSENGGDCEEGSEEKPCYAWTGTWEFVPSEKEVADFRLTTKGTRNLFDGEGVKPFTETQLWAFDGTKYVKRSRVGP